MPPGRIKNKKRFYLWQSRGNPKVILILQKSRHMQRWFFKNPWIRPMATFNLAAIRIQALARRYIVRKLGVKWRAKLKKKRSKPKQLDKYLAYIDHYSSFSSLKKPCWLDDGYSTWCAVRIQSWWRMINVYRYCRYKSDIYEIAAIEIQTTFRSYRNYILEISHIQQQRPSSTQRSVKTVDSYARAIQYSWRRYCNMRVYNYFRDLVLHKLRGAPADLLRTIIPRESDLLDKASGIHVRFRLGGRAFPPKIYYKIFTHRALCDVNAFAPRNYCQERRLEPSSLHTKPESHRTTSIVSSMQRTHIRVGGAYFESLVTTEESNGWYRRQDTNPWRVISSEVDDLFDHQPYSYLDPSEASGLDTSLVAQYRRKVKMKSFHYSTLKRQQDVDQARKRKKREWMLKAYLLTAGSKGINYESEQASVGSDGSIYRRRADSTEEDVDQYGTENKPSIEMCDSFSSGASEGSRNRGLSEQADYKHHDDDYLGGKNEKAGRVAKPSGSQQDKQKNRDQIRYQPPINDDLDGGAEDALLKWSMALDFEEYSKEWMCMATSMPSDADRELVYNSSILFNTSESHSRIRK